MGKPVGDGHPAVAHAARRAVALDAEARRGVPDVPRRRAGDLLRAGMKAVDLGAAPGGWTWQLVQPRLARHRRRQRPAQGRGGAGPAGHPPARRRADLPAAASGRLDGLRHRRAAGAHRRAGRALDRRRRRAAHDLQPQAADEEALRRGPALRGIIDETLGRAGVRHTLGLRQLYHDREEVTGCCCAGSDRPPTLPRRRFRGPRRGGAAALGRGRRPLARSPGRTTGPCRTSTH